jgi:hypothetical protein
MTPLITDTQSNFTAQLHLSLFRVSQRENYYSKLRGLVRLLANDFKRISDAILTDSSERNVKVFEDGT